ncbi:MAG: ABC transporter permease [Deltaproteobacteria bacterium]|nr:ABC transporter permease [Deltaproteobacteria bacterium]
MIFPPFSTVILEITALVKNGVLFENLADTLLRVVAGLCAGTAAGIIVGIAMGWRKVVGHSLSPVISLLYPIPALGWLPLMMLWIGINEMLPIMVITVSAFFPVCYNTASGVRSVDQMMVKAAHLLGASEKRILFEVILPNAAPQIFAGLRLSSGMAWRTVLAAEMVAIPTGIGALIMKAESLVRVDIILSCLFVLSILCLIFEKLLDAVEKNWLGRWSNHA